jgi:two-component system chemotaxis response regulator CheV
LKPDSTVNSGDNSMATGIVKIDGKLIIILDFEEIVAGINPETGLKASSVDHLTGRKRNDTPILIAEDSILLSKMIVNCLSEAGYVNVTATNNGQECWDRLCDYYKSGNLDEKVSCVITDIEMPQMDGHHLTKLIKESDQFCHIPVVIFSSLINEEMRRKGESLGADAQLSKPEIGQLVAALDNLIGVTDHQ